MSALNSATTAVAAPLMTPWVPGPVDQQHAPVVVSVTEFSAHHRRDLPGVAVNGLRMRMGWYAMPGAVGLWLWSVPAAARSGSISIWATEGDLERFINLPHHVGIMQRYAPRGSVRSTTWTADTFDSHVILDRARTWIAGRSA
jgi:hypothetical protein